MGEIAERRLGDPTRAAEQYERALAALPTHLPAITRLKSLYDAFGTPEQKLRMLGLEARASMDPEHAISTLLEVATLQRERFGDINASIDCYFQVLERDPMHGPAVDALEELLGANGRWDRLVALYRRRAEVLDDPSASYELLSRAARLTAERVGDLELAAELYLKLNTLRPGEAETLRALGKLFFALERWDESVQAFDALIALGGDQMALVDAHFKLGVIFAKHRPNAQRAINHLATCADLAPRNREAWVLLATAYTQVGAADAALKTHVYLLSAASTDDDKRTEFLAIAELYESAFSDFENAARGYREALALTSDPGEKLSLIERAAGLYQRSGNLAGYVDVLGQQANALADVDPSKAAELCMRAAQLVAEKLKDPDRAVRIAKRGLELDGRHHVLRGFLADLYSTMPGQHILAVEEHRRVLRGGMVRLASVRALYKGWLSQRAMDRAFVAAELLSFLREASDDESLFFEENKGRIAKESDESLDDVALTNWVIHPDQRNVIHEILYLVSAELGKVNPDDLGPYEVSKGDILGKRSSDTLRRLLGDPIGKNLGNISFDIWKTSAKRLAVEAHNASPLVLVVGTEVSRRNSTREQRFLIGRKVMALRCGHHLVRGMNAEALKGFLSAIAKAVDRSFVPLAEPPDLEPLSKRIQGALSRGAKKALIDPVAGLDRERASLDFQAFIDAIPMTEARAGLVVCSDLAAAVRLAARDVGELPGDPAAMRAALESSPLLADLIAFAVSDAHFMARQALRLAVDS